MAETPPPVLKTGTQEDWFKLPVDVRLAVGVRGIARLKKLRDAIAADAGLPMPTIKVEPCGWLAPGRQDILWAVACDGGDFWSVTVSAAALVAIDDDQALRQLLVHEFAHVFWLIGEAVRTSEAGGTYLSDGTEGLDPEQTHAAAKKKDAAELVDPADWFGPWDVEHFLRGDPDKLPGWKEALAMFQARWVKPNLPLRVRALRVQGEDYLFPEEVYAHIQNLEARAKALQLPQ